MKKISVIGLDLAKDVFQVHGIDDTGAVIVNRQIKRKALMDFFSRLKPCLIGIEACGGSHYWHRALSQYGHEVKMMAPAFVKAYLKANKNDRNDAEAICEAVQRPSMRFVSPKTPEQQSILHLHHGRSLLVEQRIAISNHMRSILLEYGIAIPPGNKPLLQCLPDLLEDGENELPMLTRHLLAEMKAEFNQLQSRIDRLEQLLKQWHCQDERSQRLETIPGIGLQTATVLAGAIDQGQDFKNGRHLAAYLGLVPSQASSGGKDRLLGISKRGDSYIRKLLIHGARSVIRHIRRRLQLGQPGGNPWVEQLLQRCHPNEVAVALANKMARIAWVLLARNETYRVIEH